MGERRDVRFPLLTPEQSMLISAPDCCFLTNEHSSGCPAGGASSHFILQEEKTKEQAKTKRRSSLEGRFFFFVPIDWHRPEGRRHKVESLCHLCFVGLFCGCLDACRTSTKKASHLFQSMFENNFVEVDCLCWEADVCDCLG